MLTKLCCPLLGQSNSILAAVLYLDDIFIAKLLQRTRMPIALAGIKRFSLVWNGSLLPFADHRCELAVRNKGIVREQHNELNNAGENPTSRRVGHKPIFPVWYICAGVFPAEFYGESFGALSAFEEELAKKSSLSSTAMS